MLYLTPDLPFTLFTIVGSLISIQIVFFNVSSSALALSSGVNTSKSTLSIAKVISPKTSFNQFLDSALKSKSLTCLFVPRSVITALSF